MWGRNKRRPVVDIQTLIGSGTRVQGDIEFTGGCHVDGDVVGNVRASGPDTAVLSISEGGRVQGSVAAPHVVLNGTVHGDVVAAQRVELGATARVVGNVHYRLIEMAIGAEVNGKLVHEDEKKAPAPPERDGPAVAEPELPGVGATAQWRGD